MNIFSDVSNVCFQTKIIHYEDIKNINNKMVSIEYLFKCTMKKSRI